MLNINFPLDVSEIKFSTPNWRQTFFDFLASTPHHDANKKNFILHHARMVSARRWKTLNFLHDYDFVIIRERVQAMQSRRLNPKGERDVKLQSLVSVEQRIIDNSSSLVCVMICLHVESISEMEIQFPFSFSPFSSFMLASLAYDNTRKKDEKRKEKKKRWRIFFLHRLLPSTLLTWKIAAGWATEAMCIWERGRNESEEIYLF